MLAPRARAVHEPGCRSEHTLRYVGQITAAHVIADVRQWLAAGLERHSRQALLNMSGIDVGTTHVTPASIPVLMAPALSIAQCSLVLRALTQDMHRASHITDSIIAVVRKHIERITSCVDGADLLGDARAVLLALVFHRSVHTTPAQVRCSLLFYHHVIYKW